MSIQLISISHKNAPLEVRERFAFSREQQMHLMKEVLGAGMEEAIVISTCNRTELYFYKPGDGSRTRFDRAAEKLLLEAGAQTIPHMADYLLFYRDEKAIHHLFKVAAGLDSMVMGEDQILGQVKRAQELAKEAGTTGKYLNALFRYAVTSAKKVKTDTELSKSSISTATLAIKAGERAFGSLSGKNVLVIGGSGQIGSIVLKNLYTMKGVNIFSTVRNVALTHDAHAKNASTTVVEYAKRYDYLDEADLVISATASPHYTLTFDKAVHSIHTVKERVFVDLAVPPDIEGRISHMPGTVLYNMDDLGELARANNAQKEKAVLGAKDILLTYEEDFARWLVFSENAGTVEDIKNWMLGEADRKGFEKAIDKLFYRLREQAAPKDMEILFENLRRMER